jgi:hypothetical protein
MIRSLTARALLGVGAGLLLFAQGAGAGPTIDGELDTTAGYTSVASSPKDNLLVYTDASSNPVNDNTDPRARVADVTDLYATNDGNALYVWVGMPHYDFANAQGDWSLILHLGGANDAVAVVEPFQDPYIAGTGFLFYNYPTGPNAVVKANFKSPLPNDGTNGFSDLVTVTPTQDGWDYGDTAGTRNFFGMDGVPVTATSTMVHSSGHDGAELAYRQGDGTLGGVEMKIPLGDFNHNGLTPPKVGDVIKMQFATTVRDSGGNHQRAAVDTVPFEATSRYAPGTDPPANVPDTTNGFVTTYASYTLKAAAVMDLDSASFVDLTHLVLRFTDNPGDGADVPANYTVVDVTNANAPVSVTAAAVDGTLTSQVNLTTATLTYGHTYKITVANVKSTSGGALSAKNTAQVSLPVQVTFELTDNGGIVKPTDVVTVTGDFRGWTTGEGQEPVLTLVDGKTNVYSVTVTAPAGSIQYKYRLNFSDWDTLNKANRSATIQAPGPVTLHDVVGGPVQVTFHLTNYQPETVPAGRDVYVTGDWNGFSTDPLSATPPIKMEPVAGQPGVYQGSGTINQSSWGYKYILVDPTGTNGVDYDTLNANNRNVLIVGAGDPLAQTVNDTAGTPPAASAADILKVVGGLVAAPDKTANASAFNALDADHDGVITLKDVVTFAKS